MLQLRDDELSFALSAFVAEVRKKNGQKYPPSTVFELVMAIQAQLNIKERRSVKFMADKNFETLKLAVDNVMKERAHEGLGLHVKQAQVITVAQEQFLWEKGFLGDENPQQLVRTVLYLMGVHFGLRSGEHHRNIRRVFLSFGEDQAGKYLSYREPLSKTYTGGLAHRHLKPKIVKAYAQSNPRRCIVTVVKKYMDVSPNVDNAFYLTALRKPKDGKWFSKGPIGVNSLSKFVGDMCQAAGFEGELTYATIDAGWTGSTAFLE